MDKRSHAVSLLLLMVLVVVSVLGVLALVTARSDRILAERQAAYATGMQNCTNQAMRWLSELEEGGSGQPRYYSCSFTDGAVHRLDVTVLMNGGSYRITEWKSFTDWEGVGSMGRVVRAK